MTGCADSSTSAGSLARLLGTSKPIIGTVHLEPLPGAPRYKGQPPESIYRQAREDAQRYVDGGVDAVLVENEGDTPFLKPGQIGPETVAGLTAAAAAVSQAVDVPVGIFCLANAVIESIAIAKAVGASFVRANQWANAYVANEGFIEGAAATALRFRAAISATDVQILADVHAKHGSHAIVADRSLEEMTRDVEAFDADASIVTGQRTGDPPAPDELRRIVEAATRPVLLGSGIDADNVSHLLELADGAIIGSALKTGGVWWNPVSVERTRDFMSRVRRLR